MRFSEIEWEDGEGLVELSGDVFKKFRGANMILSNISWKIESGTADDFEVYHTLDVIRDYFQGKFDQLEAAMKRFSDEQKNMILENKKLLAAGNDFSNMGKLPMLLPCKNGIIDLQTGDFVDENPGDHLLKACLVEWWGIDEPCPTWEQALAEIFSGNKRLIRFIQRVFGYALIGEVRQSLLVVLSGQGRSGKKLIVEVLREILGPLAGALRREVLSDRLGLASSGPSPDIMALRGRRMVFTSEIDNGFKISPVKIKWLISGDNITGRNLFNEYEVQFKPTHTLFLLDNHKPHVPADNFAFWERVVLIPFELSFVDREPKKENERRADPELPDKLRAELPGILAWLVKGCLHYQKEGLNQPSVVKCAAIQ